MGFERTSGKKVYQRNGIYFYEVGHYDNFDACAPFFDGRKTLINEKVPRIEGPSLIGMAKAATDLEADGYSSDKIASYLVPTTRILFPDYDSFNTSYTRPSIVTTDFGGIVINYRVTGHDSGEVDVDIRNHNNESIFFGPYNVYYS